jgi:thiamine-monophosphate kinase
LGHILQQSAVGAVIDTSITSNLIAMNLVALQAINTPASAKFSLQKQLECVLSGGDDYELLFTAPPDKREAVQSASTTSATKVTRIGRIEPELGLRLVDSQGQPMTNVFTSFDHFKV